jgi:selenocysteine lyase/cysteine desulfurase
VDRRGFLVRTGLTFAASALATLPNVARAAPASQTGDWEAVRGLFSLDAAYLHFGGLYLASHPAPVQQAIDTHRQALNANPVDYMHQSATFEANVLRSAASYLGADPADIALTDSTTMGLGLLYTGLSLRSDQEILTTQHDFYATTESLRLASERSGASMRQIALYAGLDAVSEDEIVQSIARALTDRTRVLAVTWVHSSTGLKLPIRQIADLLDQFNAQRAESERVLLCVDGVHGFGVEDVSVADLGCDFFVSGTHKWLLGPRGTGLVWGRGQTAWSAVRETIPTFGSGQTQGSLHTPGGFHSFEHRWALREAFDLHQQLGRAQVAARIHSLNSRLKQGLATIPGVRLLTPLAEDLSAGLVVFDVGNLAPQAIVEQLHQRSVIATTTPYSPSHARLAASLLNDEDQVDRAIEVVRAIA